MTDLNRNLLLRALPADAVARLTAQARVEEIEVGQFIFDPGALSELWLPLDGVISLMRQFEDGTMIEIAMVGAEGAVGVNALLGVETIAHQGVVQGRGSVARVPADVIRAELQRDSSVEKVLLAYVYAFLAGTSQLAACNRRHEVGERLAHWLLLLHDRVGSDTMSVTQEFLSHMLATRRASINEAVRELTEAGAIEHGRNRVRVIDRKLLEELSCECYSASFADYVAALGFPPVASPRTSPPL